MKKRQLLKQIKKRGPIIWSNASSISMPAQFLSDGEYMPQTYYYDKVETHNSYSALFFDGNKKNIYSFSYYDFDEDEDVGEGWTAFHVTSPLKWKTEKSFLNEEEK